MGGIMQTLVVTNDVADSAITTPKLATDSVTLDKLAPATATAGLIVLAVPDSAPATARDFDDYHLSSAQFHTAGGNTIELRPSAVGSAELGASAVRTINLGICAVDFAALGATAVHSQNINAAAVHSGHIQTGAVNSSHLQSASVNYDLMQRPSQGGVVLGAATGIAPSALLVQELTWRTAQFSTTGNQVSIRPTAIQNDYALVSTAQVVPCAVQTDVVVPTNYGTVVIEVLNAKNNSAQNLVARFNGVTTGYFMVGRGSYLSSASAFVDRQINAGPVAYFYIDGDSIGVPATAQDVGANITITLYDPGGTGKKRADVKVVGGLSGSAGLNYNAVLSFMQVTWLSTAAITAVNVLPLACLQMEGKIMVWGKRG